jgi:hypothetical protein
MTPEGYNQIKSALAEAEITAHQITPVPQTGEDVRFLDIRTQGSLRLSEVMNALGRAGLLLDEGSDDYQHQKPALALVNSELISLSPATRYNTFEDFRAQR